MADSPAPRTGLPRWREPYLALIELSWPVFLALVTLVYLLIHLLFAGLYLLDPAGIGGTESTPLPLALQAYFFSVETMATIGYGALYPKTLWVHGVMTAEALVGLILVAVVTGLAFARFARTPQGIRFGKGVRIDHGEGGPSLVLELHNRRHTTLHHLHVRAFWSAQGPGTAEAQQLLPLGDLVPPGLPLEEQLVLRHPLNPDHALCGDPLPNGGVLLVCCSAVDATLERPIHILHRYGAHEIRISRGH